MNIYSVFHLICGMPIDYLTNNGDIVTLAQLPEHIRKTGIG